MADSQFLNTVKFFLTFPKSNCVNETARQKEAHGWRSLLVFGFTQNISIYIQNIILQSVTKWLIQEF